MFIDLTVVGVYLALVFIIAFFSRREDVGHDGEQTVNDQYLASRSLTLPESLGSIIATETSALTFLGIPAFAYTKDFSFLHIYMGAVLGRYCIARFIVPAIYGKGLTIYGIMAGDDKGDTVSGQRETALIYMVTKFLAVGVRLYSGSILVAEFFSISIYMAVTLITILTFIYTLIGGLKAVVRTDLLQASVFIIGGICAHYLIPKVAETPWDTLISMASDAGKTSLFSLSNWKPFFIGITGGFFFDMCTHGVDQDFTQRLMACRDQKTAKRAIFFSSFFSIMVGSLFLGIGALLWAHYQQVPPPVGVKPDRLFAYFITQHFPVGLKGLMLAGVLAATMSTLDSTMNALSACLWNDIFKNRDVKKIKKYIKVDTLIISVIILAVALIASQSDGLLVLGLKIASWSGGALAAIFFSQLLFHKWFPAPLNGATATGAYLLNLAMVALNTYVIQGPWQWNVYYGVVGGLFFFFVYGKVRPQLNRHF